MITWLVHAHVVQDNSVLNNGYVGYEHGVITDIGVGRPGDWAGGEVIDVQGSYLVPGFIDVHVHGADGTGFMEQDFERALKYHARFGTTALLATTSTASVEMISVAIDRLGSFIRTNQIVGSKMIGLHIEGPFISKARSGAQDTQHIIEPDIPIAKSWLDRAQGLIKLMTVAPERPGALSLIEFLKRHGVTVGAGHTDASFDEAMAGIRAGVTHSIHTFNGMRPIHHRDPGVLSAVLSDQRVTCELIADGLHVDKGAISLMYRAKGATGIVLITDSVHAAGLPDGVYGKVRLTRGKVELIDGSSLAGSTLTMGQAYKNMRSFLPITPIEASLMASTNPAKAIGVSHRKGRIAVGMDADLVVLNDDFDVVRTIVEGTTVYTKPRE